MANKKQHKIFITQRLVKSEDLNHHGSLYAGRSAEWLIESGFAATADFVPPKQLVCVKLHGMHFAKPARAGDVICFESKVVYAGRTSFITYNKVYKRGQEKHFMVDGFITFVHVTHHTQPKPHGIVIVPKTAEEKRLYAEAKKLRK
jgi:acyl-CoA hydrolase